MKEKTLTDLLGFVDIKVQFLDGTEEMVKVRQLPVSELSRYSAVMEDECATVELFCSKPKGWADTITHESFTAIMEKGEGMNLDFLAEQAARQLRRREKVMPGFQEKMMQAALSRLPAMLPESPQKSG